MTNEPCKQQDLRAIVASWNRWEIDNAGELESLEQLDDSLCAATGDIEEYQCMHCGQCFVRDGSSTAAVAFAWEEALKHLTVESNEVAA